MIYSFPITEYENPIGWMCYENFFSKEECQQIIDLNKTREKWRGGVINYNNPEQSTVMEDVRRVDIVTVEVSDETMWIYDRLCTLVQDANQKYHFDLHGFFEEMQLLEYNIEMDGSGFYTWHMDVGPGPISKRKLTVICQLTDEQEYVGCDTEVMPFGCISKAQGSVTIFPSYMTHRVTPIIKGTRHALVAWVNGNPFR
jgi:PKHD-type hydroxylase